MTPTGPPPSSRRKDSLRVALHVFVYVVLYFITAAVFGKMMVWLGGYLVGVTATGLIAALFANWLALRIYENRHIAELGLFLRRPSGENLAMGIAGGAVAACLVLLPVLALGAAHFAPTPQDPGTLGTFFFVMILLAAGAAGEEIFFRGYGFQLLVANLGPYATILPIGVVFALLHSANPSFNDLALANTAGFGILFGYAYLRSRDLWLPIGLHFGWNFTLPLFGVNLSGLRMKVTGHEMVWTAGRLWSGGDYGPEASILTTAVLVVLFILLWKAPIRRQPSPLTGPPAERVVCERSPPSLL
jgi:membrane protease YdiL (CAAX protease family)